MQTKAEVWLPLSQGKVAVIDFDDFEKVRPYKWHAVSSRGQVFYAVRNKTENGKRRLQTLHRALMGNPTVGLEWGHKDGEGLNCRRENLMLVTHAQNAAGRRGKTPGASSQYRGVSWNISSGIWRARINPTGEDLHLGMFDSEIEAAKAYDVAATKYFGEYAALNFPTGGPCA